MWFDNPQLLNGMALAKLTKAGDKLRKVWAWVEPTVEAPDYEALRAYGRTYGAETYLSEAEAAEHDELAELANGDVIDDEGQERLDALIAKSEDVIWTGAHLENAGCIVTVGHGGKLEVKEGLVRPDDVKAAIEPG